MKTFLVITLHEKEKTWRIALNSTAHIEEIGELEGKISLFEGILLVSEEIWVVSSPRMQNMNCVREAYIFVVAVLVSAFPKANNLAKKSIVWGLTRRKMNSIPQSFAFSTILSKSEVTSSVSRGIDRMSFTQMAAASFVTCYNAEYSVS